MSLLEFPEALCTKNGVWALKLLHPTVSMQETRLSSKGAPQLPLRSFPQRRCRTSTTADIHIITPLLRRPFRGLPDAFAGLFEAPSELSRSLLPITSRFFTQYWHVGFLVFDNSCSITSKASTSSQMEFSGAHIAALYFHPAKMSCTARVSAAYMMSRGKTWLSTITQVGSMTHS
ncbi:hypothetical protein IG631_24169 [Alternaria alternata]|nr:hypothetical protein IG631_24169 [Alternaria alternata]